MDRRADEEKKRVSCAPPSYIERQSVVRYGDGGRASRQAVQANRVEDREPTGDSGRQCTPDCRHERMAYVVARATITS